MLNKIADTLCRIGGDKFVHLLICQLIAFAIGKALTFVMNRYVAALLGLVVAVTVVSSKR